MYTCITKIRHFFTNTTVKWKIWNTCFQCGTITTQKKILLYKYVYLKILHLKYNFFNLNIQRSSYLIPNRDAFGWCFKNNTGNVCTTQRWLVWLTSVLLLLFLCKTRNVTLWLIEWPKTLCEVDSACLSPPLLYCGGEWSQIFWYCLWPYIIN